jgi:hypothetical protein
MTALTHSRRSASVGTVGKHLFFDRVCRWHDRNTAMPLKLMRQPLSESGGAHRLLPQAHQGRRQKCRRKIEMSPGVQSRDDTPGGGEDNRAEHYLFLCSEVEQAHLMLWPDRLRSSVTGEAEAGSAGEQPAEE